MKHLSEILPSITNSEIQVSGLQYDSRKVKPGDLFFAVPGYLQDGAKFISPAFKAGARAAIVKSGTIVPAEFSNRCFEVEDVRIAMADAAVAFYGNPAKKMKLYGITGTKGKTSTAYLLESIFKAAGRKTAILGTVECRHPEKSYPSHHTTMEAIDLQRFLAEAAQVGVDTVVMEVSSHALSLHRVRGCEFDGVLFTNLSPDHMDFYKGMEDYFAAKRLLFLAPYKKEGAIAVTNADDSFGQRLLLEARGEWFSFGKEKGLFRVASAEVLPAGANIDLLSEKFGRLELRSQMAGEFSFLNIAAAATMGLAAGCSPNEVKDGIASLRGVPGRLERVPTKLPFLVFVDFAHSGHALENVLLALKPICRGKLIALFGAGGDKDPARRTNQGRVAAQLTDFTIITSDNPRSEDPLKIIEAIEKSFVASGGKNYILEPDRKLAIRKAVEMCREGDVLCLAGKGHETGQIVGEQILPFDDRVEAALVLRELEGKSLRG